MLSPSYRHGRYRPRKITVEPVCGQTEAGCGCRQISPRGLDKLAYEWGLASTADDLTKLATAANQIGVVT